MSVQLSLDDFSHPHGLTRADLMTAREVADLLAVPISTVHEWGRNGTLPRVKLGRHVRYIRRHIEAVILDAEETVDPKRRNGSSGQGPDGAADWSARLVRSRDGGPIRRVP